MNTPVARRVLSAAAAAALGLSLTACSALSTESSEPSGSDAPKDASGTLSVAVSFYPIQYLAETIGGDHVSVTSLTPTDVEPHDYDLSGKEVISTLEGSSLVAYVAGFQPSLDKAVTQISGPTVVDLSGEVDLRHHEGVEDEDEHGEASDGTTEKATGEAGHEGHDHDAGSLDPHFWLDPVRMKSAATAVEEALAAADPDNADDYKANLDSLTTTLDGLDSSYKGGLTRCERKTFITSHAAFGYLADRYGLTQVSISGIDLASLEKAKSIIESIVNDVEPGQIIDGTVVRIMNFGAFVQLSPNKDGMVHISKLADGRVNRVEDVVQIGDKVRVKVLEIDKMGRINLTMRPMDLSGSGRD